jgi:hypothetical protein
MARGSCAPWLGHPRGEPPDALHLASIEFLRSEGRKVELATYDERLGAAAESLEIPLLRL